MSVIDNLITDRTSSDVSRWSELKSKGWSGMTESEKAEWSAGMKGAYKYTDLNRVNEAMVYLQNRLRGYGYLVDVVPPVIEEGGTTRPYWAEGDIPTLSQMEQYLQNVSNIRAVLEVLQTTPPVPSDMVGLTFEEANDIERILVDVETVINRVVAGFFRSNAFTVICGNRPLPSAQSDLGRTWDDIDAEALTWGDLDDHGSSWYVIQCGVLKGAAVGIL